MPKYTIETYLDSCEAALTWASKRNKLGVLTHLKAAETQRKTLLDQARVKLEYSFITQVLDLWDDTCRSIPLAWKHQVAAYFTSAQ